MLRASARSLALIAACTFATTIASVTQAADMVESPGYYQTQRPMRSHQPRPHRVVRTTYVQQVAMDCDNLIVDYRYNGTREVISICYAPESYRR